MNTVYKIFLLLILISSAYSQWLSTYGTAGDNKAYAITVDTAGSIYTTGYVTVSGQGTNMMLLKYNSTGQFLWAEQYNGTGNGDDKAYAITVDANGFIYICGYSYSNSTGNDITVVKYNTNGSQQWIYTYSSPGFFDDKVYAITVDGDYIYIGGYVTRTNGADYAVIALNNSGQFQWLDFYNGTGNGDDKVYAITIDGTNNVAVTGSCMSDSNGLDYFTISYNQAGNRNWTAQYDGKSHSDDIARSIGYYGNNIIITGSSRSSDIAGSEDYATVKYDNNGVQQWVSRYDGTGANEDIAYSLVVNGNFSLVTGSSRNGSTAGTEDIVTQSINGNGLLQWVNRFNGIGSSTDIGFSISSKNINKFYVAGLSRTTNQAGSEDIQLLSYDNNGNVTASSRIDGPDHLSDAGTMVFTDNSNNLYLAGYVGSLTGSNMLTGRFDEGSYTITTIIPVSNNTPGGYMLKQNYPNPFNPVTRIEFSVPVSGFVKLELFDIIGNLKDILVKQNIEPGEYIIDYRPANLPSGVYFYRISAGTFLETKKMVLIK